MIVDEIRRIAEAEGVAVLGFGPASEMADEPAGYRPEDVLPGAKGLICFGAPLPRAVYQTPANTPEVICRSQSHNYRRLDMLSIRFAALLEEHGEQALPIYGCAPLGINVRGDVTGYLNQIRMGVVAGVGVIGRNGLLINARYGARLMLGAVVTTAALPRAAYPAGDEPGCPPDCRICVDACPVKAISVEQRRVRVMRCLGYTSRTPLMSKPWFVLLRAVRPAAAARLMNQAALDEHILHVCSRCVTLCPYGGQG
jgi:epoxyqueuosine reductase QueG